MYLAGTSHIAIFYFILGLTFGILPYVLGWWEELATYLNKLEVDSRNFFRTISVILLMVIVVVILTHYHNFYFFPGSAGKNSRRLFISFGLFWLLPLSASLSGVVSLIWHRVKTKLGDIVIFSIIFSFLGLAASNIHDIIYCLRATGFFTTFKPGYELTTWAHLFNSPTYDYRVFGTYMILQTIVFLLIAHSAYFSHTKGLKGKASPLLWGWVGTILLAAGMTVLDFPWLLRPPWFHTLVEILLILLSIPAFYKSGSEICEVLSKRSRFKGL